MFWCLGRCWFIELTWWWFWVYGYQVLFGCRVTGLIVICGFGGDVRGVGLFLMGFVYVVLGGLRGGFGVLLGLVFCGSD